MDNNNQVRVLGKIDLDALNISCKTAKDKSLTPAPEDWRMLRVVVQDKREKSEIILFDPDKEYVGTCYSLIIGMNGVGKSFLLRAILEFYIDIYYYTQNTRIRRYNSKYRFKVISLQYRANKKNITIDRSDRGFIAHNEEGNISLKDIIFPNIIAAHFGLYDRFPIKTNSYNVPFYRYVGAKAGGNFISTNNIITQMLFNLCEVKDYQVIHRVANVFDNIGYIPALTVTARMRENNLPENVTQETFVQFLEKYRPRDNSFYDSVKKRVLGFNPAQWDYLLTCLLRLREQGGRLIIDLKLLQPQSFEYEQNLFASLYILKQLQIVGQLNYTFFKNDEPIDGNCLSSGEANMLATVVSIASSVGSHGNLILLDEPELNQHPNWQMKIISELDNAMKNIGCQFLIASHSHFLVSDLPMDCSSVVRLEESEGVILSELIKENTYGWSAEDVLLQVFHTTTDRNTFFAMKVGRLLEKMKDASISKEDVMQDLHFLKKVSCHLHEDDPMKMVVDTILSSFAK